MPLALLAADPPRGATAVLSLWPIWLPLAVGGLAIFWLLPRPKPNSREKDPRSSQLCVRS